MEINQRPCILANLLSSEFNTFHDPRILATGAVFLILTSKGRFVGTCRHVRKYHLNENYAFTKNKTTLSIQAQCALVSKLRM